MRKNNNDRIYNWVEKYRPNRIDDVCGQEEIKNFLRSCIKEKNVPHLILYGPPGTGKTSIVNALIREIYRMRKEDYPLLTKTELIIKNQQLINDRILMLNASDERGIRIIREKIKTFSLLMINRVKNVPNFKIIVLDESDAMSDDSQFALRQLMEKNAENTRFILMCNYIMKIIPPILSRCINFIFLPIPKEECKKRILKILKMENIEINMEDGILDMIYEYGLGDLRKTITFFQKINYMMKNNENKMITKEIVKDAINDVSQDKLNESLDLIEDEIKFENNKKMMDYVLNFVKEDNNVIILIKKIYKHYLLSEIDDIYKGRIIECLNMTLYRINVDGNIVIQLMNMLLSLNVIYNGKEIRINNCAPINVEII